MFINELEKLYDCGRVDIDLLLNLLEGYTVVKKVPESIGGFLICKEQCIWDLELGDTFVAIYTDCTTHQETELDELFPWDENYIVVDGAIFTNSDGNIRHLLLLKEK